MRNWRVALGLMAGALIILGVLLYAFRPLIAPGLLKQISFSVLFPGHNNPAKISRSSIKYDPGSKILTYKATLDSAKLTVTNQAAPDAFTDVPQSYDKVIASMGQYGHFDTSGGVVYLTRPPGLNNQSVAVTDSKGTLMFVRTDHDLSEDQWRKFFNNLNELK